MATTGICNSWKLEAGFEAGHCFLPPVTPSGTVGTNGQFTLTSISSTAGIAVGMVASGANVASGAVVASIDSASQVTVSKSHTGTVSAGTVTFTADAFKLALVKVTPSRTFDATQTNIGTPGSSTPSATNLGTDEIGASGTYSSGGMALTNVAPLLSSSTAVGSFSNVSITSATISTTAAIIYNTSTRLGGAAAPLNGRTVSVHDFGGTQQVTSGTLTLTMPSQDSTSGLLRIA